MQISFLMILFSTDKIVVLPSRVVDNYYEESSLWDVAHVKTYNVIAFLLFHPAVHIQGVRITF